MTNNNSLFQKKCLIQVFGILAIGFFGVAAIALLIHDPENQRQYDTQMLTYGLQLIKSVSDGTLIDYIFTSRKYPLLLNAAMAIPLGAVVAVLSALKGPAELYAYLYYGHPVAINLTGRSVSFLSALGTAWLVFLCVRKLHPKVSPLAGVFLLASSTLFLVFSSAVRPHMPAAFMAVLVFYLSLRLAERKTLWREIAAFGASAAAFAILQNGFFTLIFPVFAFLIDDGKISWKRLFTIRLAVFGLFWATISLLIGYPYLINSLLSGSFAGKGLGNTDFDTQPFNGSGFFSLLTFVRGSEVVIVYFTLKEAVTRLFTKEGIPPMTLALILYIVIYLVFFGSISSSAPRMFLPLIPLLAIFASPALYRSSKLEIFATFLIVMLMVTKMTFFALRPNSWQLLRDYLVTTRGTIATDMPRYFIDIPPTRKSVSGSTVPREKWLVSQDSDLPGARDFVSASEIGNADLYVGYAYAPLPIIPPTWSEYKRIISGPTSEEMFLWSEADFGLKIILGGERLGPSFVVYGWDEY